MASSIVLPILLSAQDKFLNGQFLTIILLDISSVTNSTIFWPFETIGWDWDEIVRTPSL